MRVVENAFCEEIQKCLLCFFNSMFICLNPFVAAHNSTSLVIIVKNNVTFSFLYYLKCLDITLFWGI